MWAPSGIRPRPARTRPKAAIPGSNTSSSGRIPRSSISRASSSITSGGLTEALVRKLFEPSVSEAMSGFEAPSRSSTSARRSTADSSRPLVVTQTTSSGSISRIPATIGAVVSRRQSGCPAVVPGVDVEDAGAERGAALDVGEDRLGGDRNAGGAVGHRHHAGQGDVDDERGRVQDQMKAEPRLTRFS